MNIRCRDLGLTDYADCWELQRTLFAQLMARKTAGAAETAEAARKETGPVEAHRATDTPQPAGAAQASGIGRAAGTAAGADKPRTAAETTAMAGTAETHKTARTAAIIGTADARRAIEAAMAGTDKDVAAPTGLADRTVTGSGPKIPYGDNSGDAGTVLLTEHRPVYTLGKSGHAENLLVDRSTLEAMGAQFFHIDRGGDITFHGPGQLVCYPILDLERLGLGLRGYVDALEESVIRTVDRFGIRAGRIAGASGVWIDPAAARPRKICAIGVRSSRYVTMHGFALNVTTDLSWFSRINPCGFTDRGVTSIAAEGDGTPSMERVKALVLKNLSEILNVKIYNN